MKRKKKRILKEREKVGGRKKGGEERRGEERNNHADACISVLFKKMALFKMTKRWRQSRIKTKINM